MIERFRESPLERRARYIRLAREAKELAAKSKTMQMREACLAMAQSWLALATDLDGGSAEAIATWNGNFEAQSTKTGGSSRTTEEKTHRQL